VTMILNDKPVCTSKATYGGAGSALLVNGKEWQTITTMSECSEPINVKNGDILKISATVSKVKGATMSLLPYTTELDFV
jgi:hypothetical protein